MYDKYLVGLNNMVKCVRFTVRENVGYMKNGEKICHFYDMSLWRGGSCLLCMYVDISKETSVLARESSTSWLRNSIRITL